MPRTQLKEDHQRELATAHLRIGIEPRGTRAQQKYAKDLCRKAGIKIQRDQFTNSTKAQLNTVIREAINLLQVLS